MQLEERLLGLDEQLRAVRVPSPFRPSALPVCCWGPESAVGLFMMWDLGPGTSLYPLVLMLYNHAYCSSNFHAH